MKEIVYCCPNALLPSFRLNDKATLLQEVSVSLPESQLEDEYVSVVYPALSPNSNYLVRIDQFIFFIIHWPSYNRSLVRLGEILFSYDYLDTWGFRTTSNEPK